MDDHSPLLDEMIRSPESEKTVGGEHQDVSLRNVVDVHEREGSGDGSVAPVSDPSTLASQEVYTTQEKVQKSKRTDSDEESTSSSFFEEKPVDTLSAVELDSQSLKLVTVEPEEYYHDDDSTALSIEKLNRAHAPPPSFDSPTPSSTSRLRSQNAQVSNSRVSSVARSLSLPAIYRLGLGTLGRSYALTGLGGDLVGRSQDRHVYTNRAMTSSQGVESMVEEWIARGDKQMAVGQEELSIKFHVDVSHLALLFLLFSQIY